MNLREPLKTEFSYRNKKIRLRLSFDAVLRMYYVFSDKNIHDSIKTRLALAHVLDTASLRRIRKFSESDVGKVIDIIAKDFISIPIRRAEEKTKAFDFEQDVVLIVSAFKQAYGVDLYREIGKLDWRIFISMLAGMPANTKFSEVCNIRTCEIPAPTKHNAKEIQALIKAKTHWSLSVNEEAAQENFQKGINQLAEALIGMAKNG